KIWLRGSDQLAERSDDIQKAAFAAVVGANQDGKVTQIDRDVAQALVVLNVQAVQHGHFPGKCGLGQTTLPVYPKPLPFVINSRGTATGPELGSHQSSSVRWT